MKVREILQRKGDTVATVDPSESVATAVARLAEHGVGALVASTDGAQIDGIVSERDVVRAINTGGPGILDHEVSSVMTVEVHTCEPDDHIDELMRVMTDRRIRHLPVVEGGALTGIISIGDVVKRRLDQLENENRNLTDYISGR
ncbi:MAG: CBS domain-containing protein [Acidimicrobiia bacterium]|nr:CBS domain-containing protein [Acidimicrobiia bacterium]